MNYFAHGMRFIDRPYVLAGTAVPDWLSVSDRKVRMRKPRVEPFLTNDNPAVAELATGVLQHLADDHWFHQTSGFYTVTGEMSRRFREVLGDDGHRSGFLGHIVTELLLDAVLMERHADLVDPYYDAMSSVDPAFVQEAVGAMARDRPERLAGFIDLFCEHQFLRDYADPARMRFRLNQIMSRVRLKPLPVEVEPVLAVGYDFIDQQRDALLPPELYTWPAPAKHTGCARNNV